MVLVLFMIFVVVPVIEISLLIEVGARLGGMTTIALVILTALLGASLVRSQGLKTLLSLQQRISMGEQPAQEIIEGVMLAIAGILLVTPGFMTDAIGLIFLTPWSRQWLAQQALKRIKLRGAHQGPFGGAGFGGTGFQGNTYDGEVHRQTQGESPFQHLHSHTDKPEEPLEGEYVERDKKDPKDD